MRFHSEKFDPNIRRTLKWSLGAETMDELVAAHKDVMADRVPQIVQFGSGPLSVLDPTQAPPGKHTTYAWHVMPFNPDIGARDYETFKQEFAERIIEKWARYAPNMTRKNIIAQHVYTAREYTQTFPEMRGGDIFMGAFSAEQVMYNHFGYRTPIDRLYMAGSATHPGGAISGGGGYISAGVIARELGLEPCGLLSAGGRSPSEQLLFNLFLNCSKPLFGARCPFSPVLNLRRHLMCSIFGRSEFHGKLVCKTHSAIAVLFRQVGRVSICETMACPASSS